MKIIYNIGKRDALAELFMLIRMEGVKKTLNRLAKELNATEPKGHTHAQHYLDKHGCK